jgi:hypothetical protein
VGSQILLFGAKDILSKNAPVLKFIKDSSSRLNSSTKSPLSTVTSGQNNAVSPLKLFKSTNALVVLYPPLVGLPA